METSLIKQPSPFKMPNLLPWAIISTICCCMPLGVMAIIYTEKALSYHREGDFEQAKIQVRMAKLWLTWAFILGIGVQIISHLFALIFYLLSIAA